MRRKAVAFCEDQGILNGEPRAFKCACLTMRSPGVSHGQQEAPVLESRSHCHPERRVKSDAAGIPIRRGVPTVFGDSDPVGRVAQNGIDRARSEGLHEIPRIGVDYLDLVLPCSHRHRLPGADSGGRQLKTVAAQQLTRESSGADPAHPIRWRIRLGGIQAEGIAASAVIEITQHSDSIEKELAQLEAEIKAKAVGEVGPGS
ncbi:hypothetical protein ABIB15_002530 [Marisediminicola sp. UYEF4]